MEPNHCGTSLISKDSYVDPSAYIQSYSIVSKNSTILAGTKIGHNVFIGEGVYVGADCLIQGNCFIPSGVTIGRKTFIGPGVTFCNVKHPPLPADKKGEYLKTSIGFNSSIGAGATILPGLTIHPFTVIGAGAVMTKSTKSLGQTYVGNPARELKKSLWKQIWSFLTTPTERRGRQ